MHTHRVCLTRFIINMSSGDSKLMCGTAHTRLLTFCCRLSSPAVHDTRNRTVSSCTRACITHHCSVHVQAGITALQSVIIRRTARSRHRVLQVQSIAAGIGGTLDVWDTKGTPRVYLIVCNDLVVGFLAVEDLLRSHVVKFAHRTNLAQYLRAPVPSAPRPFGPPSVQTTSGTSSALYTSAACTGRHGQHKEQQRGNCSPSAVSYTHLTLPTNREV